MAEEEESKGKKISLAVTFQNRDDINLSVKPTTQFAKVYKAIAANLGVAQDSFRLDWDGVRMGQDQTPKMHEFSEEESLEYHVEVVGGSY